jgi:mitochondrial fusion and transport protein UGO1
LCVHDALFGLVQPFIDNVLQSILFPSSTPFQQPPLLLPVASHLLTGFILSPLDLVRTRLIIQSFIPRYRTYSGPIDALSQILRNEGGLKGVYLHPHLLIPTIIDHTLRSLVSLALPGLIASYLVSHVSPDSHPIAWGFAELTGNFAGLLITLPFETVRRRLQAQVRGSAKPVKACVEMRPAPYNGVVDTLWHILTEERSDLPLHVKTKRARRGSKGKQGEQEDEESESWFRNTGLGQLYRGLGMRLGASAIVFLLAMVSGGEEKDTGWAEL